MPHLSIDKAKLKPFVQKLGSKDYLTVAGRVFAAHDARQFIGSDVDCEETADGKFYRCKAYVKILNTHLTDVAADLPAEAAVGTFTGLSQSKTTGGKSAEGTNPLEVAETSALGRALGFAGFGVLDSIASFEEVETALGRSSTPSDAQKAALFDAAKGRGLIGGIDDLKALALSVYSVPLEELTKDQVAAWTKDINTSGEGAEKAPF